MRISLRLGQVLAVTDGDALMWARFDLSRVKLAEMATVCHSDALDERARRKVEGFLRSLKYLRTGQRLSYPCEFSLLVPAEAGYVLVTPKCQFVFKRDTLDDSDGTGTGYVDFPGQYRVKDELRALYASRTSANSQRLLELKIRPPKGVILHGPPGVGKTAVAKRFCASLGIFTVYIDGTDLGSKYYGESEKKVTLLLKVTE
jgi:hypothetical protein